MGQEALKDELIEEQKPDETSEQDAEFEGMSDLEIQKELYRREVEADPDLDDLPEPPAAVKKDEEDDDEDDPPNLEAVPKDQHQEDDDKPEPTPEQEGIAWLNTLPEEDQKEAKAFLQRLGNDLARKDQIARSHLGQLRPAQQAVARLQRRVRELEAAKGEQQQGAPDVDKQIADYNKWVDEEYKDFPEEADKLKAQFAERLDGVKQVLQQAKPQKREDAPEMAPPDPRREMQHLETAYSDWGERRHSVEFSQWFSRQPPQVKMLLNSPYGTDNIEIMDRFTADNPEWQPPQTPDEFVDYAQARHSPLFKGWAEAVGLNPQIAPGQLNDHQRDMIMRDFRRDLGTAHELHSEEMAGPGDQGKPENPAAERLAKRRQAQLKDRQPGSRRSGVTPGQVFDLDTEEGQKAYYKALVAADKDA